VTQWLDPVHQAGEGSRLTPQLQDSRLVDVDIPVYLYIDEELKGATEAALKRREGASRSLRQLRAMKEPQVSFGA
jgi:hypothetical protein